MAFRPGAGRELPHETLRLLRALISEGGQLVETRKRLLAHEKLATADMFVAMDESLKSLPDRRIAELDGWIEHTIAFDREPAVTSEILRPVAGIGPVASAMLIAEIPELDQITGNRAAALTGLAPIAHDSGAPRGKRTIDRGRRPLSQCSVPGRPRRKPSQPGPESFASRLRDAVIPHRGAMTAVA